MVFVVSFEHFMTFRLTVSRSQSRRNGLRGAGAGAGAVKKTGRLRLRKGTQLWKATECNGTAKQQTAEQTDCLYFSSITLEQVQ